jgi:Leucine-rich repeat (LRR) protein
VNLTKLDLEYNDFRIIPECIGRLILLEHLDLSDNHKLAGVLPDGICDLIKLEHLEIEHTLVEGIVSALIQRNNT